MTRGTKCLGLACLVFPWLKHVLIKKKIKMEKYFAWVVYIKAIWDSSCNYDPIWFVLMTNAQKYESLWSNCVWACVPNKKQWLHQTQRAQNACILLWRGSIRLTHPAYKPLCFCLTHSAGKLDFPSPLRGIAQLNYFITDSLPSNAGDFCLGMTLFSNKQTEPGSRRVQGPNYALPLIYLVRIRLCFLVTV